MYRPPPLFSPQVTARYGLPSAPNLTRDMHATLAAHVARTVLIRLPITCQSLANLVAIHIVVRPRSTARPTPSRRPPARDAPLVVRTPAHAALSQRRV